MGKQAPRQLHAQTGAMFGLDARIALAIFAIIAVIAGVAVVMSVDSTRAKSLATELTETGHAIELYHNDLKEDIFATLDVPSTANAFEALYDDSVITDQGGLRSRWNGPYIKYTSNDNPHYGNMFIEKHAADHTQACDPQEICYLYLIYSRVKPGIVDEVNTLLDGKYEQHPDTMGRVQWSQDNDAYRILYYRVSRALTSQME